MKIIMLWGKREGKETPELLDAIDEYSDDENPEFINEAFKIHLNNEELIDVRFIETDLDSKELKRIFASTQKITSKDIREAKT